MRRVSILQLEEVGQLLLQIPDILDVYERGGGNFPARVLAWLKALEESLKKGTIMAAGGIATLRGELLSGESGVMPVDICPRDTRPKRKHRNALAVRVLKEAELLVREAIADDGNRVAESMRIAYQIVVIGMKKGLLHQSDLPVEEGTWSVLERDEDILSLLVHMQATVGKRDARLMLTRSLSVSLSE